MVRYNIIAKGHETQIFEMYEFGNPSINPTIFSINSTRSQSNLPITTGNTGISEIINNKKAKSNIGATRGSRKIFVNKKYEGKEPKRAREKGIVVIWAAIETDINDHNHRKTINLNVKSPFMNG